jgi:hypothetical protein
LGFCVVQQKFHRLKWLVLQLVSHKVAQKLNGYAAIAVSVGVIPSSTCVYVAVASELKLNIKPRSYFCLNSPSSHKNLRWHREGLCSRWRCPEWIASSSSKCKCWNRAPFELPCDRRQRTSQDASVWRWCTALNGSTHPTFLDRLCSAR